MNEHHLNKKLLDDSLSYRIFDRFIELLDPSSSIFSSGDLDKLALYRDKFDDDIRLKKCVTYLLISNSYSNRLKLISDYLNDLKLEDFPSFNFVAISSKSADRIGYDLKGYGGQVKFNYLRKKQLFPELSEDELFHLAQQEVKCEIDNLLNPVHGFSNTIFSNFLRAITLSYDPHSNYLSLNELNEFQALLSTENEGFGLTINKNLANEFLIDQVMPGGSAANQSDIKEGDKIIKLEGDDGVIDLACQGVSMINNLLGSSPYKSLTITLSRKDTVYSYHLTKSNIEFTENTVSSYLLDGATQYAYIKLPSFYSKEDDRVSGLADDVAKELFNLKSESIEGLILDLRNNGGGNITEAIKLASLFIDEGPLFMMVDSEKNYNSIYDPNRGLAYDGPIMVLVNSASASASELFAGIIQDWGRGLVFGSKTYGKSTMQSLIPIFNGKENKDFIYITTKAMLRTSGISYQSEGIIPDISYPDQLSILIEAESELPYQIVLDNTSSIVHEKAVLPIQKLIDMNEQRRQYDSTYLALVNLLDKFENGLDYQINLNDRYVTDYESMVKDLENFYITAINQKEFKVVPPEHMSFELSLNPILEKKYYENSVSIEQDAWIFEAFNTFNDLLIIINQSK